MLTLNRKSSPADRGTTASRQGSRDHEDTWGNSGTRGYVGLALHQDHEHEIKQQILITNRPEADPSSREVAGVQGCKRPLSV